MHTAIEELLQKRGIKSLTDLSTEEKEQFDKWQKVLVKEPITIAKLTEFLHVQKSLTESQLSNIENSTQKNDRLIVQLNVYSKLINFISSDEKEKESLIKYLTDLKEV